MVTEVAKYQFQSWVRRGIAAHINEQDTLGDPVAALPPGERASVPIGVSINSTPQTPKNFVLIGPGDIIGIQREMVVRTEPRHWVTNVEPNYLAFIEFYDEDFPWRYTPAHAQGEHLRPWIYLLVLKEGEFERNDRGFPLPRLLVKSKAGLPPSDETWLFAHVHTEQDLAPGELSTLEKYLHSLREAITTDPDKIYSRLLSPRHLEHSQAYDAFLVPAFEVGRLAGLGQPTAGVSAQKPAWDASTTGVELPFYYDWHFSTGEKADFESLVALLDPVVLDERVGRRSMDTSRPGFVRADSQGLEIPPPPGGTKGLPSPDPAIQGLEGALKTENTLSLPLTFRPNVFQDELQILVNLPETIQTDLAAVAGTDEDFLNDPVVTVPFYGQNHARQHKTDKVLLDVTKTGWYHDLNRDPRTRVPAAFGTRVIQKHQDRFMQRAWQQVQRVYEGNRKIRSFQFTMQFSRRYTEQIFARLEPEKLVALTLPVHAKVMGSPTTIRQQLSESRLQAPVFSAAFRRLVRPAGKVARRLQAEDGPFDYARLVAEVNANRANPAPPRAVPKGIPAVDDLAQKIQPRAWPDWLVWLMHNRLTMLLVLLVLLALLLLAGILSGAWAVVGLLALVSLAGYAWLAAQQARTSAAEGLVDPAKAQAAINAVPSQPDFNVTLVGESGFPPGVSSAPAEGGTPPPGGIPLPPPPATVGPDPGGDSQEAHNFRRAAGELQARLAIRPPEKAPLPAFDLANASAKLAHAIQPEVAFPFRLSALVKLPNRKLDRPEEIVDAMAQPDFEDATYTFLRDINKELLIPNLQLIPQNSISLLETNPPFIESYLVGLNHEMGRELLWREYPTDLRGSYFRQFWEVKGVSNPDRPGDTEQLKDITKIHAWPSTSPLGVHKPLPPANADVQPGDKQLVLVVRGELLKRYPNTVIYAQKAFDFGDGTRVIHTNDLDLKAFGTELKFPLFRAEIEPDLRFFGFDLTIPKARGNDESNDFRGDHEGWFFVIQEVPGEPRFGMDIAFEPTSDSDTDPSNNPPNTWNNLAWDRFGVAEPNFVKRQPAPTFPPKRHTDLTDHRWADNAAQMAYILFQTPVMVAVHATEMLK